MFGLKGLKKAGFIEYLPQQANPDQVAEPSSVLNSVCVSHVVCSLTLCVTVWKVLLSPWPLDGSQQANCTKPTNVWNLFCSEELSSKKTHLTNPNFPSLTKCLQSVFITVTVGVSHVTFPSRDFLIFQPGSDSFINCARSPG